MIKYIHFKNPLVTFTPSEAKVYRNCDSNYIEFERSENISHFCKAKIYHAERREASYGRTYYNKQVRGNDLAGGRQPRKAPFRR